MPYIPGNLNIRLSDIGDNTLQICSYSSPDVAATVAGAGYITDGFARGLKANDIVFVTDTTTPLVTSHRVQSVNAITGATNLSAGTIVGAT